MAPSSALSGVDLTDLDRFADGFPHDLFTVLRREAPVWRQEPTEHTPDGEGFWVITRHADLLRVVRDPATFSSDTGPGRDGAGGTILEDLAAGVGPGVMLNMCDPPTHNRIRGLVSRDFTARPIERLTPFLEARTALILDAVAARGSCDFLVDVAAELPLQTIARILGVPESDSHQLFAWTNTILDYRERDLAGTSDELATAALGMVGYGGDLIEEKRRAPADDMLSAVIHARLEGEHGEVEALSPAELSAFFSLLFVAGSETTRNSIAGGLLALIERPEQLTMLRADRSLVPSAVEEILRWTSATAYNRRTATRDVELGGQLIRAGEKTTHWYPSANRDETVFADPLAFVVDRDPNPHVAFGGGLHHCLGAALARTEIRVMLEALLDRFTGFELAGPVEWGRSNKHTSIRSLPITLTPR
jgi:cytochrome P450